MAAGLSPALTLDRGSSEVVLYVEKKICVTRVMSSL